MSVKLGPAARHRLTMLTDSRQLQRVLAFAVYTLLGRHLPWSNRPFGQYARRLRAALGEWMLDECGDAVNIEHGALFGSGRGIRLGDRSDIGMDALVIGPVHIGADVMMGPRCVLIAGAHNHADPDVPMNTQGMLDDRPIVIEDDVWIGAGSTILPGRKLGSGCIVGAGSVITRDVPSMAVVGGNPAQVIRYRTDEQVPSMLPAAADDTEASKPLPNRPKT
ncbi:acyltransferase [uncultured Jatrophihabitans sp.]|uniref:acyltransferase n=1 Tax=uncultured Jatrophihabitans sp. TaxID=1610747 RepID=UPI0035CC1037